MAVTCQACLNLFYRAPSRSPAASSAGSSSTAHSGQAAESCCLQHHNGKPDDQNAADPDKAPQPQPERQEPTLPEPTLAKLSRRDYLAIVKRSIKEMGNDHMTNIAAALAYYSFLAIPSVLMVALGIFALVGDTHAVTTLVGKLGGILPGQAQSLVKSSLTNLVHQRGTGNTVLALGTLLALWSLTGAMQNVIWGLNVAYDRDETRGFVRRRLTSLIMVAFAALAVLLVFGLLVLGPHMTGWIGTVEKFHRISLHAQSVLVAFPAWPGVTRFEKTGVV